MNALTRTQRTMIRHAQLRIAQSAHQLDRIMRGLGERYDVGDVADALKEASAVLVIAYQQWPHLDGDGR